VIRDRTWRNRSTVATHSSRVKWSYIDREATKARRLVVKVS